MDAEEKLAGAEKAKAKGTSYFKASHTLESVWGMNKQSAICKNLWEYKDPELI